MGIPGFYRWLRNKCPMCFRKALVEEANGVRLPVDTSRPNPNGFEFDNLYLDMNGIIHPCFHPQRLPDPENYDEVFEAIFKYIDRIFSVVRPRKLLFLAIDGVAPLAKMNQQRSRRFRVAKDIAEASKIESITFPESKEKSPSLKQPKKMDPNVITPGTEFMDMLSSALRYYIHLRMNEDLGWRGIKVILSDASVPGEGEHKIMSYIHLQRNLPGYNPNTRHCLYGLDSDLIMRALVSHEIHFTILREDGERIKADLKSFRKRQRKRKRQNSKGDSELMGVEDWNLERYITKLKFKFLNIWVLREYLAKNMRISDSAVGTDMERLIDDFVLICLFVGNDFLPHLPGLAIHEGAIDLLLMIYKDKFVQRGGYLTNSFEVNLERLGHFLQAVGANERKIFLKRLKKSKRGKSRTRGHDPQNSKLVEVQKQSFYTQKFEAKTQDDRERIRRHAVSKYIEGVCWVMHYYYEGVCSWKWFYPYHYAPFASDFCGIDQLEIHFTLGEPFKPLNQLMAVLPAASAHAVPLFYRKLMMDESSPILDFYPTDFEVDMQGVRVSWQAICKLPFIEESRLLAEIAKVEHTLTDEERQRNNFSLDVLFVHSSNALADKIVSFSKQMSNQPKLINDAMEQEIDPKLSGGMNGYIYISDKPSWPVEIHSPMKGRNMIPKTEVISVLYKYPLSHPHIPRPTEGVIFPQKNPLQRKKSAIRKCRGHIQPGRPAKPLPPIGPCLPKGTGRVVNGYTLRKRPVTVAPMKLLDHAGPDRLEETKTEVRSQSKGSNYNPEKHESCSLSDSVGEDTLVQKRFDDRAKVINMEVIPKETQNKGSNYDPEKCKTITSQDSDGADATVQMNMEGKLNEKKRKSMKRKLSESEADATNISVNSGSGAQGEQIDGNGSNVVAAGLVGIKTEVKNKRTKKKKQASDHEVLNINVEKLEGDLPREQKKGDDDQVGTDRLQEVTTEVSQKKKRRHKRTRLNEGDISAEKLESSNSLSNNSIEQLEHCLHSEWQKEDGAQREQSEGNCGHVVAAGLRGITTEDMKKRSKKKKQTSDNIDVEILEGDLPRELNKGDDHQVGADRLQEVSAEVVSQKKKRQRKRRELNEGDISVEKLASSNSLPNSSIEKLEHCLHSEQQKEDGAQREQSEVNCGHVAAGLEGLNTEVKNKRSKKKKQTSDHELLNINVEILEGDLPRELNKGEDDQVGTDRLQEVSAEVVSQKKKRQLKRRELNEGDISVEKFESSNSLPNSSIEKLEHCLHSEQQKEDGAQREQSEVNFGRVVAAGLEGLNTEVKNKRSKKKKQTSDHELLNINVEILEGDLPRELNKGDDDQVGTDRLQEVSAEVLSQKKKRQRKRRELNEGDISVEKFESSNSLPNSSIEKLEHCLHSEQQKEDGAQREQREVNFGHVVAAGLEGLNTEVKNKRSKKKKKQTSENEHLNISVEMLGSDLPRELNKGDDDQVGTDRLQEVSAEVVSQKKKRQHKRRELNEGDISVEKFESSNSLPNSSIEKLEHRLCSEQQKEDAAQRELSEVNCGHVLAAGLRGIKTEVMKKRSTKKKQTSDNIDVEILEGDLSRELNKGMMIKLVQTG